MPKGVHQGRTKARADAVRTAALFARWMELITIDKKTSDEAVEILSKETGFPIPRLKSQVYREGWLGLSQKLLPATRQLEPTSTTAIAVLDTERKSYLELSRKLSATLNEKIDYIRDRFQKARENDNPIQAQEMIDTFGKLALAATRIQTLSMNATCDSGSATAITEPGRPEQGDAMKLYLISPMMAEPRIRQPGSQPLTLELLPETPPIPAQGNGH